MLFERDGQSANLSLLVCLSLDVLPRAPFAGFEHFRLIDWLMQRFKFACVWQHI